jgi:hypothetical protein
MATSPAHKFGQYLGNVLEALFLPELNSFCEGKGLYVDCHGERPGIRSGRKATWTDKYGNKHDLDFVIEKNASATVQGRPLAFIETAWRRYTKHSRNKAQEIQGAVLPIAEAYAWDKPFLGTVLAGNFTAGSLTQLASLGFHVVYIPYKSMVEIYAQNGIDIAFDESTIESEYTNVLAEISAGGHDLKLAITTSLRAAHRVELDTFLAELKKKLLRHVEKISLIPLFGKEFEFGTIADVIGFIRTDAPRNTDGAFRRYEISVTYSNGDRLDASFSDKNEAERFLIYAAA